MTVNCWLLILSNSNWSLCLADGKLTRKAEDGENVIGKLTVEPPSSVNIQSVTVTDKYSVKVALSVISVEHSV